MKILLLSIALLLCAAIDIYLYWLILRLKESISQTPELIRDDKKDVADDNCQQEYSRTEIEKDEDADDEVDVECDVSHPTGKQLTEYMSYLESIQLSQYEVFHCQEKEVHGSNPHSALLSDGYLFHVAESSNQVLLVYENGWRNMSTYFFAVNKCEEECAVKSILCFFHSWEPNKRDKLRQQKNHFSRSGVIWQESTNHREGRFNDWVMAVRRRRIKVQKIVRIDSPVRM